MTISFWVLVFSFTYLVLVYPMDLTQLKNTSNLIFLGFKVPSESFFPQDYFLTYMVLKNRKMSSNVFPYRWDTIYEDIR